MAKLIDAEQFYDDLFKLYLQSKDSRIISERNKAAAYNEVMNLIDHAPAAGFTGSTAHLISSIEITRLAPGTIVYLDFGWCTEENGKKYLSPICPSEFVVYDIDALGDGSKVVRFFDGAERLKDYGREWVAWTAKPTNEQREAVIWPPAETIRGKRSEIIEVIR